MTDQDLIGYLERLDQKMEGLREEIRQTRTVLEEENRQTRTALEEEIRQTRTALEEGDRQTRIALEEGDRQTRVMVEGLRSDVQLVAEAVMMQGEAFAARQVETLREVEDLKALFVPHYQALDSRVRILEEKADRETRDVLTVLRERYGKH